MARRRKTEDPEDADSSAKEEEEKENKTTTLAKFMAVTNKHLGERTIATGLDAKRDPPRIPFNVFAVDYASGGGIPVWGTTGLYGPESGGKTTLALSLVGSVATTCWRCYEALESCSCSESPLKMKTFWADAEGTLDAKWAAAVGCQPEDYYYCLAEYGEMYVNLAEKALRADDCGLVVVDSIAALTPEVMFESAAEDQFMGTQARMITRAVQKLKQRMVRERRRGHPCSLLFTNQIRKRIGVMFGDPETMAGGHALLHEFSLLLRVVKKALDKKKDAKYVGAESEKDACSRHSFVVRKEKLLTLSKVGEFRRLKLDVDGLSKGTVDDFAFVAKAAKQYGILTQDGKLWVCRDRNSTKLLDLLDIWKEDKQEYHALQREIIIAAKKAGGGLNAE